MIMYEQSILKDTRLKDLSVLLKFNSYVAKI